MKLAKPYLRSCWMEQNDIFFLEWNFYCDTHSLHAYITTLFTLCSLTVHLYKWDYLQTFVCMLKYNINYYFETYNIYIQTISHTYALSRHSKDYIFLFYTLYQRVLRKGIHFPSWVFSLLFILAIDGSIDSMYCNLVIILDETMTTKNS